MQLPDVAPWRDRGSLTFCDGDLRIGNPGTPPAGFCADVRVAPRPCETDGDCRSRERCTCAGCQIAVCDTGDECGADRVCTFADRRCDRACAGDGDCAEGEVCVPGANVCRGRCAATADCQQGEVCDQGMCGVVLASGGDPCSSGADCADPLACAIQRVPDDLREPAPLVGESGRIVVYVERRQGEGQTSVATIFRAVGSLPAGRAAAALRLRFESAVPVLAPDATDLGRASAPTVIVTSRGYLAVYADAAGLLRRATSSDGIVFSVDPAPLLSPAAPWEKSGLDAPALVAAPDGAGILLYYATVDRTAIGVAESADGVTFTRRPDPVLTPAALVDPALFRDVDRIASPFAERVAPAGRRPSVRLFFAARGRESKDALKFGVSVSESPNFSIAEASSTDGVRFVAWPWNPVFDRTVQLLDHPSELDPAVLDLGARRLLLYRGASADEKRADGLGLAENPPR